MEFLLDHVEFDPARRRAVGEGDHAEHGVVDDGGVDVAASRIGEAMRGGRAGDHGAQNGRLDDGTEGRAGRSCLVEGGVVPSLDGSNPLAT